MVFGLFKDARPAGNALLAKLFGRNGPEPLITDETARKKRSRRRWDLTIRASDPKFAKVEAKLQRALERPDESTQGVLDRHFTAFEKKLLIPVERKRHPGLYRIQQLNRRRYQRLLRSARFADRKSTASLAFKLALLYFGLPVAPMELGVAGESVEDACVGSDVWDDDDDVSVNFGPEEDRPLRFLNAYQNRTWGSDSLREGRVEFEAYYRSPWHTRPMLPGESSTNDHSTNKLSLRGGGLSEDDEDAMSCDGSEDAMFIDEDGDNQVVSCGGADETQQKYILYGTQGQTEFDISSPKSLSGAVDRLLGLFDRDGVNITFGFWHVDAENFPGFMKPLSLGNVEDELAFQSAVHRRMLDLGFAEGKGKLFVCTEDWVHLVTAFPALEATSSEDLVAMFTLKNGTSKDVAYLVLPNSMDPLLGANFYEEWFQAMIRIVCRVDADKSKVGTKRAAASLSAFVGLADFKGGQCMTYGMDNWSRVLWEHVMDEWFKKGTTDFELEVIRAADVVPQGEYVFHVRGYPKSPKAKDGYAVYGPNLQSLIGLVEESLPPAEWKTAHLVEIVAFAHEGDENSTVALYQLGTSPGEAVADLNTLDRSLSGNELLIARALWSEYTVFMDDEPDGHFVITRETKWEDFEGQVDKLVAARASPGERLERGNYIIQVDQRKKGEETSPTTMNRISMDLRTEREGFASAANRTRWKEFLNEVSRPQVYVTILQASEHASRLRYAQAGDLMFGYQDPYSGCPFGIEEILQAAKAEENPGDTSAAVVEPPVVKSPIAKTPITQTQTTPVTSLVAPPAQPAPPESDADKARRLQGWEAPAARKPYNNNPQPRQPPTSEFERGRQMREWSYGRPLSVHVEGGTPAFHINAPPLEHIIRTKGSSMPAVAAQVLTASEQRKLQTALFNMRQVALQRTQKCPYEGCDKYFPLAEDWRLQRHLKAHHVGKECPFCEEILYEHWSPAQQQKHFVEKHVDCFSGKGDLARDAAVGVKSLERVHVREERYSFCPRCGRNHGILDNKADRIQHDNVCYPGATILYHNDHTWCVRCGEHIAKKDTLLGDQSARHRCQVKDVAATNAEEPYCGQCGLACGLFSRRYAMKHLHHCKGHGLELDKFCPWCGVELDFRPGARFAHLSKCDKCPNGAEGPIDTSTGDPTPSPLLNVELLRKRLLGVTPLTMEIPKKCPVKDCMTDMSYLNAQGIFYHFFEYHDDVLGDVDRCLYCNLDFKKRGWDTRKEKVQHFDDHLQRLGQRIIADKTISTLPPSDPRVLEAYKIRDENITQAPQDHGVLLDENHKQQETIRNLVAQLNMIKVPGSQAAGETTGGRKEKNASGKQTDSTQKEKSPTKKGESSKQGEEKPNDTGVKAPGISTRQGDKDKGAEPKNKDVAPKPATPKPKPATAAPKALKSILKSGMAGLKTVSPKLGTAPAAKSPPERPKKRKAGAGDAAYQPDDDGFESGDEAGPSTRAKGNSSSSKGGARSAPPGAKDPTYRPERRLSDGDNEYTEGLVPEPRPDIGDEAAAAAPKPPPKKKQRVASAATPATAGSSSSPAAAAKGAAPAKKGRAKKAPAKAPAPTDRVTRSSARKLAAEKKV